MSETKQVYRAINEVQGEMSKIGISKDSKNQQQGFMFRGIDAVYGAIAPLLYKHKLLILPRVIERSVLERTSKSGGALFYTALKMEFDFVSSEDGSSHTVSTVGEALDSGDKSSSKAMSCAYKYACFQAFAIPTEGDNDADSTTHEVSASPAKPEPRRQSQRPSPKQSPEELLSQINIKLSEIGVTPAEFLKKLVEWKKIDDSVPELQFVPANVIEASLASWDKTLKALKKTT